jgi:hypothetical protein
MISKLRVRAFIARSPIGKKASGFFGPFPPGSSQSFTDTDRRMRDSQAGKPGERVSPELPGTTRVCALATDPERERDGNPRTGKENDGNYHGPLQ